MQEHRQRGAVTLEACVSVLSFMVLMLLLSSLFILFMAQNVTAHTVLQTSESLSLDVYAIESLMKEEGKIGSVSANVGQLVTKLFGSSSDNPHFVTNNRWYAADATDLESTLKTRFIGYLANGDETAADELLTRMNVVDGVDGLDFSQSYVVDDTLYIVLKYKLEYDFNIWDLGTIEVEQKTCSKLWK